jgi:hypothetical protein
MFVLMSYLSSYPGHAPARVSLEAAIGGKFHYWTGASGENYLHTIFKTGSCPILPGASYMAIRRESSGTMKVLGAGVIDDDAHDFAALLANPGSADEIHLHLLAADEENARAVIDDLAQRHGPDMTSTNAS